MADKQPSTLKILCLATYRRISSYNWCTQLKFPRRLNELEKFTVRDPLEEKSLAEKIPLLCEILDDVSLKVRAQYENYPYPRWIKAAKVLRPQTIGEYIKEKKLSIFPEYNYDIDTPKILIAGCGTGQHSIEFAQRFKNSEVFSIDLSRASLAYAKRKSEELGLKNISFMQADIMDLGSLRDKYDVISCVGVLHHMEDPQVAWQILCNLLTDGGLMQIGLYSKLARENVARIKNDFKINSKSLTKLEIVRMRDDIANSKTEDHPDILRSKDFYSLSAVKDLLFHVHETAFTLTEIDAILNKLGLKFCGFDSQNLYSDFSMRFENETDLYSLERWNEFENLFPSIFRGMYQFWCQKY